MMITLHCIADLALYFKKKRKFYVSSDPMIFTFFIFLLVIKNARWNPVYISEWNFHSPSQYCVGGCVLCTSFVVRCVLKRHLNRESWILWCIVEWMHIITLVYLYPIPYTETFYFTMDFLLAVNKVECRKSKKKNEIENVYTGDCVPCVVCTYASYHIIIKANITCGISKIHIHHQNKMKNMKWFAVTFELSHVFVKRKVLNSWSTSIVAPFLTLLKTSCHSFCYKY